MGEIVFIHSPRFGIGIGWNGVGFVRDIMRLRWCEYSAIKWMRLAHHSQQRQRVLHCVLY